jgi:hypothetical protein
MASRMYRLPASRGPVHERTFPVPDSPWAGCRSLASLPSMGYQTPVASLSRAERRLLAIIVSLLMLASVLPRPVQGATGDAVLLNEVLVSHTGIDTTEFVELYGAPGTPLSGLSLAFIEGDGATAGTIDRRVDFPAGARLGGNGFYLIGNPGGLGAVYHVTPDLAVWGNDALENGSQTVALVSTSGLGATSTLVHGGEGVRDTVGLTDAGPSDAWFWSAPVVGPDDGFLPAGARRLVDGADTDTADDWAFANDQLGPSNTPTPATPYNVPPVANCGAGLTTDEGSASSATVSATDPDGRIVAFDTAGPAGVSVSGVVEAPAAGLPGTAQVEVGAATAPGSYSVTVTATNGDAEPQTAECILPVTINDLPDPTPEATPEPTPEPTPTPPEPVPAPTTAALWAMVNDMTARAGALGKMHLLADRLERIDRFLAAGQIRAAGAQLQALANQALALSPRWLGGGEAAALAAAADGLRLTLGL